MNQDTKIKIPLRTVLAFLLTWAFADATEAGTDSGTTTDEQLKLLTDVHAGIEAAAVQGGDYGLKTSRELQFDILRSNDFFIHFGIQENSIFDYSPSQIDHTIQYISAGYERNNGRIGLFWDHTCNNPSKDLPAGKFNEIRWNEIGIGYETTGMRLGHRNDDINFDDKSYWLHNINWSAAFSKVWMKHENDYDFMLKLGIRDDFLKIENHIFYALARTNAIYDDRGINWSPSVEIGDRFRLAKNVNLVPFVSYERFYDWYGLSDSEDFYLAGLRLEASLGPDNSGGLSKNSGYFDNDKFSSRKNARPDDKQIRFHINGGYNVNLDGSHKESRSSDLNIDMDILRFDDNKILTINTYAGILTEPGAFEVQSINYKAGPSLCIDMNDYYLRFFHSYSCLYGADYDGVIRKYNLVGAEVGSDAQLRWLLQGAAYPATTRFDYDAHLHAALGYDFDSGEFITPYLDGALKHLFGDNQEFGHALEGGLKFRGELGNFVLYLRLEKSFDVFRFGEGRQTWCGFRFVF
jgi:hypothetical protein